MSVLVKCQASISMVVLHASNEQSELNTPISVSLVCEINIISSLKEGAVSQVASPFITLF